MGSSRASFLGVPLDALTMDETIARCRSLIAERRFVQHVVLNAGKTVLMRDDPRLRRVIASCDLVSADGQSVVWAGRLLGIHVPERVAGIDLMERLLAEAEREQWLVFFLGAKPDVLDAFRAEVARRHPALRVAGARDGYFTDDAAVADEIARSGARLLFVAISSPKKELFLAEQGSRLGSLFAMGVGGSFDVWAGTASRAPRWMQKSGLEWLHRLLLEPRRMWKRYLVGNFRFAGIVLGELFRRARAARIA